jgi:hypothetical protein
LEPKPRLSRFDPRIILYCLYILIRRSTVTELGLGLLKSLKNILSMSKRGLRSNVTIILCLNRLRVLKNDKNPGLEPPVNGKRLWFS